MNEFFSSILHRFIRFVELKMVKLPLAFAHFSPSHEDQRKHVLTRHSKAPASSADHLLFSHRGRTNGPDGGKEDDWCFQTSYRIDHRPEASQRNERAVTEWRFRRNFLLPYPFWIPENFIVRLQFSSS